MRNARRLLVLMAGAFLMTGPNLVSAQQFDKVIEGRQQLMKGIGKAGKDLRSAADAAAVAASADKLVEELARISADTFPRGSTDGSRAKPETWEQWDEFTAKAGNAVTLARAIASRRSVAPGPAPSIDQICDSPGRSPAIRSNLARLAPLVTIARAPESPMRKASASSPYCTNSGTITAPMR